MVLAKFGYSNVFIWFFKLGNLGRSMMNTITPLTTFKFIVKILHIKNKYVLILYILAQIKFQLLFNDSSELYV